MNELIVPVYLNNRLVFDLLAMLQGGISTVTAITKNESTDSNKTNKVAASLGLSEAFSSLFKIGLSAEAIEKGVEQTSHSSQEERVHTPASLFSMLRNTLVEKNYLRKLEAGSTVKTGDIVEFTAKLKRNPIVEAMDILNETMSIALAFEDKSTPAVKGQKKPTDNGNSIIKKQIETLLISLKSGNTIDITASNLLSGHNAVITLETVYLNDPAMADLVDGEFKVIGKVIRNIDKPDESINLMRKAVLSKLPEPLLEQFINQLSSLSQLQGWDIPELVVKVEGPAIQVLPIAIYA